MSDLEAAIIRAGCDPAVAAAVASVLTPVVADLVAAALAGHGSGQPHVEPPDPLETMLVFGDDSRLHIHPTAKVNNAVINLMSGDVTIGEYSFFGHNVSVLTGSHDIETFGQDRQNAVPDSNHDVIIGDGVWVASNAVIVGPCRIGDNAVVGVASLVLDDVDAYTVVAGHPAKVIRVIDHDDGRGGR